MLAGAFGRGRPLFSPAVLRFRREGRVRLRRGGTDKIVTGFISIFIIGVFLCERLVGHCFGVVDTVAVDPSGALGPAARGGLLRLR